MTAGVGRLVARMGDRDLALLLRWSLPEVHSAVARGLWIGITQAGSAVVTIGVALAAGLVWFPAHSGRWLPAAALTLSHLAVQLLKRKVQRSRPSRSPVIRCPDRFSFPSGHATSSLSVALAIGLLEPVLAMPLAILGLLVGWSRVVLRVHYPGDVVAGHLIAIATVLALVV